MDDVLKGQTPPTRENLIGLARALNDLHGAFWFRKTTLAQSQFKRARSIRVGDAVQVLMCFFDQRRQTWKMLSAEAAHHERRLYEQFRDFVHAMTAHNFQLEMDTDVGALMSNLESWHDVAAAVDAAFRIAMFPQKLGRSNQGPAARFIAKVMPMLTNEEPRVDAVAQHLKRRAHGRGY